MILEAAKVTTVGNVPPLKLNVITPVVVFSWILVIGLFVLVPAQSRILGLEVSVNDVIFPVPGKGQDGELIVP